MKFNTEKLYYSKPFLSSCQTNWRKMSPRQIAVSRSVAYPEGGGQLPDFGTIEQNSIKINFIDCQKAGGTGRVVVRNDFPVIPVEAELVLELESDIPDSFSELQEIEIKIDTQRRSALSLSHSASHFLYLAMTELRPDVPQATLACRIDISGGRFDVAVEKYTDSEVEILNQKVKELLLKSLKIEADNLPNEPECRFWIYGDNRIACGGTHALHSNQVPQIKITKKNKSKGIQRIYYEFELLNSTDSTKIKEFESLFH